VFWSEEMHRTALAAQQAVEVAPHMRQISAAEAAKEVHPIEWLAEYERKADARRRAWLDSPFAGAVARVVR
jgi:hypothetical protein